MTDATDLHPAPTETCCECGVATGHPCVWRGPVSETVLVDWTPHYLRASHAAARNAGVYPANGDERLRVHRDCAERMLEEDGEWTVEVR